MQVSKGVALKAIVFGLFVLIGSFAWADPTYPPPSPRVEHAAPRSGFVWVPGRWGWIEKTASWLWIHGHYDAARPGYRYVVPAWQWNAEGRTYVFVPGGWIQDGQPDPVAVAPTATTDTEFYVTYSSSKASSRRNWYASSGMLETVSDELNVMLKPSSLPADVAIVAMDCGESNAFYESSSHEIHFCYELLDELFELSAGLDQDEKTRRVLFREMVEFIALHEAGHAFQSLLGAGGTGNSESEADHFATFVLIASGRASDAVAGTIIFAKWAQEKDNAVYMNDPHPPDAQRVSEIACLAYGSDPERFEKILGQMLGDRAQGCPGAYRRNDAGWRHTLQQFLR